VNPNLSFRALGLSPPPLEKIVAWMAQHGWETSDNNNGTLFTGPAADNGEPIIRWLPPASASDYPLRVEDLLSTVACIEERPPMTILQEMQLGLAEKFPPMSEVLRDSRLPFYQQLIDAISLYLDLGPQTQHEVHNLFTELSGIIPGAKAIESENFGDTRELVLKDAALICSRVAQTSATHRSLAAVCQITLELDAPLTWMELTSLWQAASTDDVQSPDKTYECLKTFGRAAELVTPAANVKLRSYVGKPATESASL
jgi:hypothetical protein